MDKHTYGNTPACTYTHYINPFTFAQELREPDDGTEMKPSHDPPSTQQPEMVPDLSKTHTCTRTHQVCTHWPRVNTKFVFSDLQFFGDLTSLSCLLLQCLSILKVTVKMVVVTVMGLLVFWLTDQAGWLDHVSFF